VTASPSIGGGGGPHRLVAVAPPGPGVNGSTAEQVDDADYPHRALSTVLKPANEPGSCFQPQERRRS